MAEKYSRLFSLNENLYAKGSPIIIKAGALLKDNDTGRLIAQLKLHSISNKLIKTAKVELTCYDSVGRALDETIIYDYLDLTICRYDDFGTKNAIMVSNPLTRSFGVRILDVGFSDNTVYSGAETPTSDWHSLGALKPIGSELRDNDALYGYKSIFGQGAEYVSFGADDLWCCACGSFNHDDEEYCVKCNASREKLERLDVEELRKEGIYLTATELSKFETRESLNKAVEEFEKIKDYKDSTKKIEKIKTCLVVKETSKKAKKKKAITLSAIIGGSLAVLALIGYFAVYPFISFLAGDYKVYIDMYKVEEFTVPSNVTSIRYRAFSGCDSLTSITIPDSVTSIGNYAFYNCDSLTSITIPDSVTSIEYSAFSDCESLTSITIPDSVTSIEYSAFSWCTSLTSITIPDSVTSIGDDAFYRCDSLTSITIPDSVTSIGMYAFSDCVSLTSITIPDSVTSIEYKAFSDCESLTSINYNGTMAQWNAIDKDIYWNTYTGNYRIYCTDGTIRK